MVSDPSPPGFHLAAWHFKQPPPIRCGRGAFSGLNRASRRKFMDFARVAVDYEDVMKIVDVLHGAAMRMAANKSGVE